MTIYQLRQAAENFFTEPFKFTVIGKSTGYSGSYMAQVVDAQGVTWCVRLWQDESIDTLRFVHRVLQHCIGQDVLGLPSLAHNQAGDSLIAVGTKWADAQLWVSGRPLHKLTSTSSTERTPNSGYVATAIQRRQITKALAYFHKSTVALYRQQTYIATLPDSWPTPADYVATVLSKQNKSAKTNHLQFKAKDRDLIEQWQTLLPRLAAALAPQVEKSVHEEVTTIVACHGDLWPDHTYFHDQVFSSFIDFGALTCTSPALDLAQLILHFGGWQTVDEVLSTYEPILSLTEYDRALVTLFAAWDLLYEACWALQELQKGEITEAERRAHWHNLRFFLPSVTAVILELLQ